MCLLFTNMFTNDCPDGYLSNLLVFFGKENLDILNFHQLEFAS